jgi:predicted branched-subunit amino acid permease
MARARSSQADRSQTRNVFSRSGLWRGFVAAQPIALGLAAYAVAFGLLASAAGWSALEAVLMSATVFSGSAQVAAVGGWASGAGIGAVVATVLMLNGRYLLLGAALRPWLGQASAVQAYTTLHFFGDANWALSMKAHADGESDAAFLLGSGLATFLPWVGGTLAGAAIGDVFARPEALGLDFMLVAFCAAMAAGMTKARSDLKLLLAAAVTAAVVHLAGFTGWAAVAAGAAGMLVAYFTANPDPEPISNPDSAPERGPAS